jgi:hypothetical protein
MFSSLDTVCRRVAAVQMLLLPSGQQPASDASFLCFSSLLLLFSWKQVFFLSLFHRKSRRALFERRQGGARGCQSYFSTAATGHTRIGINVSCGGGAFIGKMPTSSRKLCRSAPNKPTTSLFFVRPRRKVIPLHINPYEH